MRQIAKTIGIIPIKAIKHAMIKPFTTFIFLFIHAQALTLTIYFMGYI
ncbi:hypothetical protein [Neobacillus cucumis]|nr:hypothetical protein [Neobacillus cucumis]MBM7652054.1 hypothetical protein [Neobacillus cucumis]